MQSPHFSNPIQESSMTELEREMLLYNTQSWAMGN
jgi:hypothetical protein